jgi:hypothetical protein
MPFFALVPTTSACRGCPTPPGRPDGQRKLKRDDLALAFFSTLTMLATPRDLMLGQLRIECFYPADAAPEATARRLAGYGTP